MFLVYPGDVLYLSRWSRPMPRPVYIWGTISCTDPGDIVVLNPRDHVPPLSWWSNQGDFGLIFSRWSRAVFIQVITCCIYPSDHVLYLSKWSRAVFIQVITCCIYPSDHVLYLSKWSRAVFIQVITPFILIQVIMSRLNSMFELATQEEIDKLGQSQVGQPF